MFTTFAALKVTCQKSVALLVTILGNIHSMLHWQH
jgi:hypothetical protein